MKKSMLFLMMTMITVGCLAEDFMSAEQMMKELQGTTSKPTQVEKGTEPAAVPPIIQEMQSPEPVATTEASSWNEVEKPSAQSGDSLQPLPEKGKGVVSTYLQDRQMAKERRDAEDKALDTVTAAWSGMILRDYPLSSAALEKMKLTQIERSADVREYFPDIEFPEGAKAVYRPTLNRLYVLNTPKNIARLEAVLTALEAPQVTDKGQIEIKTRFVEFSEGALEALGFNWSSLGDGHLGGHWTVDNGQGLFTNALRGVGDIFTKPKTLSAVHDGANLSIDSLASDSLAMRSRKSSASGDSIAGDWKASRLEDGFSDEAGQLHITGARANIDLLIRALDQTSGADVLSAPSVVTRAGEEASIQVGQTHYFPQSFSAGGSEGTIIHAEYEGFKEELMGVQLSVNPKLVKDHLIEMELNPKVTELLGWRSYQIAPANSSYTYYQYRIGNTYRHDPIIAQLPIFRHREVKTKVTIQDGSTIGMGGLMSEKTETFSDRVPVLGSIPLIGRLFRSEGERTVKRNLMIFVTASKVAPNGRVLSE